MKTCGFCGKGVMARRTVKETFEYKDQTLQLDQTGEYCSECGEGILNATDLKNTRKALHDWQAQIDGYLPSDEVRRIRKKLGLTQHQAAAVFGGGPNAFGRYENGEALQLKATDNLLRLLDRHPTLLDELPKDEAA